MDDYRTRMEKRVAEKVMFIKDLPEEIMELFVEIPEEGIKYTDMLGREGIAMPLVKEGDYVDIDDKIGTYGYNNGMIAVVTPDRKTYITPSRTDVFKALDEAGYKDGGIVPLSTGGEEIQDKDIAEQIRRLKKERDKYRDRIQREDFQQRATDIATKKGISDLPEEFFRVCQKLPTEGLGTTRLGKPSSKVTSFFDPLAIMGEMDKKKMAEYVGSYNYNGGTTIFVDQNGDTWITPFTEDAEIFLEEAGYTRNTNMPAKIDSMDEFTDPNINQRYEELRKNSDIRSQEVSRYKRGQEHYEDFYKALEYMENEDLTYEPSFGYRK